MKRRRRRRALGAPPRMLLWRALRHGARSLRLDWMIGHSIEEVDPCEYSRRYTIVSRAKQVRLPPPPAQAAAEVHVIALDE